MKKFLSILIICVMVTVSFPSVSLASFITDHTESFYKSEEFSGEWKNVNKLGMIEPESVVFGVTAKIKARKPLH